MEDERIVELYFERSETAISETAKKYGGYLGRLAYNILRDASDSEEVVSDTYLGAWNAIPPARPDVLRHFLSRIARCLAFNRLDYAAAKRRMPIGGIMAELDECVPDSAGIEEAMEAKAIGEAINAFLSGLDRESAVLFVARYYSCMTLGELSERYGVSERRAKYLLQRCRARLSLRLREEGIIL